jgi:hypothetical protein
MRRLLIAAGAAAMAYAVAGAFTDPDVALFGMVVFAVAVLVLHDGVLMPLVALAGHLLRGTSTAARTAALVSLTVVVVGLPLALGFGRPADNPSALPLPYGRNLLLILAMVWLAFAVRKGWRGSRRRRSG